MSEWSCHDNLRADGDSLGEILRHKPVHCLFDNDSNGSFLLKLVVGCRDAVWLFKRFSKLDMVEHRLDHDKLSFVKRKFLFRNKSDKGNFVRRRVFDM